MIGKILIISATVFSFLSALIYLLGFFKKNEKMSLLGSSLYALSSGAIIAASFYLMFNIFNFNFQFTYIWEYASRELDAYFLFASFFAGQQGSFLLWLLMLSVVGLILIPSLRKYDYENIAMPFFNLILMFILMILIFKSPFDYVWETFAKDGVEVGYLPPNGRGMNPILQNYWITIHPPILFFGYSLMAVPFILALSGLVKKDYIKWLEPGIKWTIIGGGVLGLGIMLGGFWAYETLGWGGFWGWDPVENSSLLPWLVAVALSHTFLVQKRTGGLIKTNFVLAIFAFLFVLYATFLTRSGILGDTSVHSFITPGKTVETLLVVFMFSFILFGLGLVIFRWRDVAKFTRKSDFSVQSKEFALSIGSILIIAFTLIVWYGTSKPALADIFGGQKVAAELSFYNNWGLIFAILILVLNSFTIYLRWKSKTFDNFAKQMMIPLALTVVGTVAIYFGGVTDIKFIILGFASIFSIITNLDFIFRNTKKQPKQLGAYIAHLGIAVLVLGVVASGSNSVSTQLRFTEKSEKEFHGYKFTFRGKERIEKEKQDREKFRYTLDITKGDNKWEVHPIVYWSSFNEWQAPFFEPGIQTKFEKDIYVAPIAVELDYNAPKLYLKKDEATPAPIDSSITVAIEKFEMNSNMQPQENKVSFGTVVKYDRAGVVSTDTLYSLIDVENWVGTPIEWKDVPQTNYQIGMVGLIRNQMSIGNSQAVFIFKEKSLKEPQLMEVFTADVSIKPYMNLVWLGTILMVAGFFVSLPKYSKKNRLKQRTETEEQIDNVETTEDKV